ncbi:MAG: hypothetical protein V4590_05540 [Bacteroidota bacterium]
MDLEPELIHLKGELMDLGHELIHLKGELMDLGPELIHLKGESMDLKPELVHLRGELMDLGPELKKGENEHFVSLVSPSDRLRLSIVIGTASRSSGALHSAPIRHRAFSIWYRKTGIGYPESRRGFGKFRF